MSPVAGGEVRPAILEHDAGQDPDADDQKQGREQRPAGRADRPQLRPLGEGDASLGDFGGGHCRRGDRAHAGAPSGSAAGSGLSAWNSTASRVSSMNASSSEARWGVSS